MTLLRVDIKTEPIRLSEMQIFLMKSSVWRVQWLRERPSEQEGHGYQEGHSIRNSSS